MKSLVIDLCVLLVHCRIIWLDWVVEVIVEEPGLSICDVEVATGPKDLATISVVEVFETGHVSEVAMVLE